MTDIYTKTPSEIYNVFGKSMDSICTGNDSAPIFSMIPHFFYEFNGDPNVLVINAGLCVGPTGINSLNVPVDLLRNYLVDNVTDQTKLCFDNLYEGNFTPIIHNIYNAIRGTNIKPSQCYYFSAALDSDNLHDIYCNEHAIMSKINVISCNTWEYSLRKESKLTGRDFNTSPKDKLLVCFNRILRQHRLCLVALLYQAGIVAKSYYSFFMDASYDGSKIDSELLFSRMKHNMPTDMYTTVANAFSQLVPQLPLKLNIDWTENANYVKADDLAFFDNSYLSLVTETYFFTSMCNKQVDEQSIFFSEKTYKPILMRHPFILASRPGSLAALRQMGYKTFAPHINEEYDTLQDNSGRLNAIVNELKRLSTFTDAEWITWQENIKEIVDHNYNILINRKKYEYAHTRPEYKTQY